VRASLQNLIIGYPAFTLINSAAFQKTQMKSFSAAMSLLYIMMIALAAPGLVAMVNTLAINVLERTREIGVLRAVGSTQRQVRRMVLAESLLLAALGTLLGVVVGIWLGYVIVAGLNVSGFVMSFYFPVAGVITAVVVGMVFGVLAALAPARQAAKMNIIEALRYE